MTLISLQRFEISLPRFSKCVSLEIFFDVDFLCLEKKWQTPTFGTANLQKNNPLGIRSFCSSILLGVLKSAQHMALPPLQVVEAVGSAVAGLHNISRLIFDARKRWQFFFGMKKW